MFRKYAKHLLVVAVFRVPSPPRAHPQHCEILKHAKTGQLGIPDDIENHHTPVLLTFFSSKNLSIVELACGAYFTLFLVTQPCQPKFPLVIQHLFRISCTSTTQETPDVHIPLDLVNLLCKFCETSGHIPRKQMTFTPNQTRAHTVHRQRTGLAPRTEHSQKPIKCPPLSVFHFLLECVPIPPNDA